MMKYLIGLMLTVIVAGCTVEVRPAAPAVEATATAVPTAVTVLSPTPDVLKVASYENDVPAVLTDPSRGIYEEHHPVDMWRRIRARKLTYDVAINLLNASLELNGLSLNLVDLDERQVVFVAAAFDARGRCGNTPVSGVDLRDMIDRFIGYPVQVEFFTWIYYQVEQPYCQVWEQAIHAMLVCSGDQVDLRPIKAAHNVQVGYYDQDRTLEVLNQMKGGDCDASNRLRGVDAYPLN